jgi:hypothetical protein
MDQGAIAVSLIASSLILNVPVGSAECGLKISNALLEIQV